MSQLYQVTKYTREQASKYGLVVKASTDSSKKINVFRDGVKIAAVGDRGYSDYPTYIQSHGLAYANERRRLYRIRHNSDRKAKWSRGWLASVLLW